MLIPSKVIRVWSWTSKRYKNAQIAGIGSVDFCRRDFEFCRHFDENCELGIWEKFSLRVKLLRWYPIRMLVCSLFRLHFELFHQFQSGMLLWNDVAALHLFKRK